MRLITEMHFYTEFEVSWIALDKYMHTVQEMKN